MHGVVALQHAAMAFSATTHLNQILKKQPSLWAHDGGAPSKSAEVRSIDASIARVAAQRAKAFEQARNAEINASIVRVAAVRLKAFEQARNAEIDTSIARVEARRALLETGAISKPDPHTARTHAWPVPQRDTSS